LFSVGATLLLSQDARQSIYEFAPSTSAFKGDELRVSGMNPHVHFDENDKISEHQGTKY
jgi:hypothetical protein